MADVKKPADEGTDFPDKRKLDPLTKPPQPDTDNSGSHKRLKTETSPQENGTVPLPAGDTASQSSEHSNTTLADDDDDEEDYNAEQDGAENVDRKGQGTVMAQDKGKGKLIEDSEDDDSDEDEGDGDESSDDSDSDDFSGGLADGSDSDMEDDPLAEVDLDNILPSRTRRGRVQPGVRFFGDGDKGNDA